MTFNPLVLGPTNGYGIPDAVVDEVMRGVEGRDEGDGEGEGDE
jgi:hypothetical protein